MAEPVALEIELVWGGDVVRGETFVPRDRRVRIGGESTADFVLPIARDHLLATWSGAGWWIVPPPDARTERYGSESSAAYFELEQGERATVSLAHGLDLSLRACPPEARAFSPDLQGGRDLAVTLLASLALHACLVASAWLTPSSTPMIQLDRRELRPPPLVSLFAAAEPSDPVLRAGPDPSAEPRDHEPAGRAGDLVALQALGGGRAVARPAPAFVDASTVGILGVLATMTRDFGDGSSAYDVALASAFEGGGPLDADLGSSRGDGGLALAGAGQGACEPGQSCDARVVPVMGGGAPGRGATCGEDIVRVRGVVKVIETCAGGMIGMGHGSGAGMMGGRGVELDLGLHRGRDTRVPSLRTVGASAVGGLTKEQVQRVLARSRATLASCYAHAAEAEPDLVGRVELVLVISPSGAVQSATRGASELRPSPALDSCMLGAVRQLSFPAATGVTLATQAIVLSPAGE